MEYLTGIIFSITVFFIFIFIYTYLKRHYKEVEKEMNQHKEAIKKAKEAERRRQYYQSLDKYFNDNSN
jgi:F0F1-type ATP synthase membrane subunit b/b'